MGRAFLVQRIHYAAIGRTGGENKDKHGIGSASLHGAARVCDVVAGFFGGAAVSSRFRHAFGMAARCGPDAGSDRIFQSGHAGALLQISVGAADRSSASSIAHKLAWASALLDAGLPGTDHARAVAGGGKRPGDKPGSDGGVRRLRGILLGNSGHRHRCMED